jgi:hypothetical protein
MIAIRICTDVCVSDILRLFFYELTYVRVTLRTHTQGEVRTSSYGYGFSYFKISNVALKYECFWFEWVLREFGDKSMDPIN